MSTDRRLHFTANSTHPLPIQHLILLLLTSYKKATAPPNATATLNDTIIMHKNNYIPPINPTSYIISTPSQTIYLFPIQYFDESSHIFPTTIDASPIATTTSNAQERYSMHAPPNQ